MIEYADIQTTLVVVLAFFSAVVLIDKVIDTVMKWTKPERDVHKIIEQHNNKLEELERSISDEQAQINEQNQAIKLILKGVSQLITHELDGNHVDQLEKIRDDMNDFLISKV